MEDQLDEIARRASSFGSQAAAYAEYRPDYPAALFDWGLTDIRGAADARVLDLGAGTGKLTQGLVAAGADVVAVEPDAAMLAQLTTLLPDVEAHQGSAEDIPLTESSVNAVFVGQAMHWFDLDRAFREFRRVLRPGGYVVAAWNTYDDRVPWVAGFVRLVDFVRRGSVPPETIDAMGRFGTVEQADFPHRLVQTVDGLVRMEGTQSVMLVAKPEVREATLSKVRHYLESRPETARGSFVVPLVTTALKIRL
jgi:SAM-dependent methyltransferase